MQDIVLLSEVHPQVTVDPFNPLTQAREWHGLLTNEDLAAISRRPMFSWLDAIELIHARAVSQGRHLVVRDWTHLDFTGVPWFEEPSMELQTSRVLGLRFETHVTTTVRHPVDQWLSLARLPLVRDKLTIEKFLYGYRRFAEHAAQVGFIRFEDFTKNPLEQAKVLCERLSLPFDPTFLERWSSYKNITGDVGDEKGIGRASSNAEIRPLRRRAAPAETLRQFEASSDYLPSLNLLGYD